MKLQVIALYPGKIPDLMAQSGVKERKRKGGSWTQVLCELTADERGTVAKPIHVPPDGAPRPVFKAQLELEKSEDAGKVVALVMPPDIGMESDPEQHVVAPMYNNGRRILFEFQRADVLIVKADGNVELRLIAVHPVTGLVGTKTKYLFHHRLNKLAARCQSHLTGSIDLFPAQDRAARVTDFHVPAGPANLDLGRPPALGTSKAMATRMPCDG